MSDPAASSVSPQPVRRVAIVGGTHGNELTGVMLLKKWQEQQDIISRPSFDVELVVANPKAIAARTRYCDRDLNRCFTHNLLNNFELSDYELERARTINQQLGPKGQARVDFVIDLHTSTADMQSNVVLTKLDDFHCQMARYLVQTDPSIRMSSEDKLMADHHFLGSVAERHCLVEIGPVAQGLGQEKTMLQMESVVIKILDFLEAYNRQELDALATSKGKTPIYQYTNTVPLPTDANGELTGVVHENLQGKDFGLLTTGDPIFSCFDGQTICYDGEATYACFINEAAYYDKGLAFSLAKKIFV